MKKHLLIVGTLLAFASIPSAFSYDEIIRPYESVRTAGMGGVFETTGLYDQNFFGNPARVCANPTWRFTLFDPAVEVDSSAITHAGVISKSVRGSAQNIVSAASETAGSNNHARIQTTMPSWYLPPSMSRKWGLAIGLITSTQANLALRNNYEVDDQAIVDLGPAVTYGHTFLHDDSLAVGVTGHFIYQLNTASPISIAQLLDGQSFSPKTTGGEGTMIDADIGATKTFHHVLPYNWDLDAALAVNNVAGGKFNTGAMKLLNAPNQATPMYRSFGGGVSAHSKSLGFLRDPVFAVESSDNGLRNQNGSLWRTLHIGGEANLITVLYGRLGINQGYLAAGVGVNLRLLTIDAATYGEELGLNAGTMEDRIYALRVALQL